MTGQAGVLHCTDACKADGVACTTAQDCCGLGCFGGVCSTAHECTVEGGACKTAAECCSDICGADGRCQIDDANSRCRPTGEDCSSGHQSGCCFATNDNDLCDKQTHRCDAPPSECHGNQAVCAKDADCCSGHCGADGKCFTQCTATAGACTTGLDCCGGSCTNGTCDPPGTTTTVGTGADAGGGTITGGGSGAAPVGAPCTNSLQCASKFCLAGFCDIPPVVK